MALILADFIALREQLESGDETLFLEIVTRIRRQLSIEHAPPIDLVLEAGLAPVLVKLLERDEPNLQFELAWALTNIASGSSAQAQAIIELGMINKFIELSASPNDDVVEQAVWGLGNLAGDSPDVRDLVLAAGAAPALLDGLNRITKATFLRNVAWASSNLCRGKPRPSLESIIGVLPILSRLLPTGDDEVSCDCLWGLSYITDDSPEGIDLILNATPAVIPLIVHQLTRTARSVQTPALRTVGNLVTGDDTVTQVVINCGAVLAITPHMRSESEEIQKEAAWALSNITAGPSSQIQAVIDAGTFPVLVDLLNHSRNESVLKEGVWVLNNSTAGGTPMQLDYIIKIGGLHALAGILTRQPTPTAVILSPLLGSLENFLAAEGEDFDRKETMGSLGIGAALLPYIGLHTELDPKISEIVDKIGAGDDSILIKYAAKMDFSPVPEDTIMNDQDGLDQLANETDKMTL